MVKADHVHAFLQAWHKHGLAGSDLVTEYRFHPVRKWRLDIAFPSEKLGVELDGFGYGHQSIGGLKKDHEKANALTLLGWRLLRFTSSDMTPSRVRDAVEVVKEALCLDRGESYEIYIR